MWYWNPKPLKPEAKDGLFQINKDESYTVTKSSPIQKQRALDGTPVTINPPSSIKPSLPRTKDLIVKSKSPSKPASKPVDPDAVIKAFFEGRDTDKDEEAEKGIAEAAVEGAKKVTGAAGKVVSRVTSIASQRK